MGNNNENSFQNIKIYRHGRGNKKHTLNNAIKRREPRKYIQTVIRTIKTAELNETSDHLLIIWNGFDIEFQHHIEKPNKITTLNVYFQLFDRRKHQ